jgi:hypothetical protein
LHGDIRRLGVAAGCRDQSGPLKIVSGWVVEADCGRTTGGRKGRNKAQDRNSASQSGALTI